MNHITNGNRATIEQMTGKLFTGVKTEAGNEKKSLQTASFQSILLEKQQENESLKFSKHANARMESRNIELSDQQMERLEDGASKAKSKGIQESLVMVDEYAFIVNTKNNTVVTAVNDLESSVFTNIDGAVIS